MFTSAKGFTVAELLISMAIGGVVLAGMYTFFISASKSYVRQNAVVQMQADARAAMDFMVRELRHMCDPPECVAPAISTTVAANDTISFDRVEDAGTATGGTGTTLSDASKATTWRSNQFASGAYQVRIIAGIGTGQTRTISGNTSTQLTVSAAWAPPPNTTSLYLITRNKTFTRTSTSDNVLRYRIGAGGDRDPLADNITSHAFAQPDANTISITLTARTTNRDPTIKSYRTYTLTETVQRRN